MKKGSIVEYVGGQCEVGESLFPLQKETPYVVTFVGLGKFSTGIHPSIAIDVSNRYEFLASMFRELQPPVTSEEILEAIEEEITA